MIRLFTIYMFSAKYLRCDSCVTARDEIPMTKRNSPLGQRCVRRTKTLLRGACFPPGVENVFHFAPWRRIPRAEQALKLSTNSRGDVFNRAIPFRLRVPREIFPRAVEAQIEDLEVAERV